MPRSRKFFYALMGLVLLTAGACTAAPLIRQKIAGNRLQGTQWQLAAVGAHGSQMEAGGDTLVTLTFTSDLHVGGTDGCSVFGGDYEVTAWGLKIKNMAIRSVHCDNQSLILAEIQYLDMLTRARGYDVRGDQLILWDHQGRYLLNYSRSIPPGLVGGLTGTAG